MLLAIAFIAAMLVLLYLLEDGRMDEEANRRWIDYLADRSRRKQRIS